jgi:hypothetical protein
MLLRKMIEDLLLSLPITVFCIITFSLFRTLTPNNKDITPAISQNYICHPTTNKLPIPAAERSNPWFCGHSSAAFLSSNSAREWMLCVAR